MPRPAFNVAAVRAACRTLPEPRWHRISEHPSPRRAASLVPLIEVDGEVAVVLTKRASALDHGGDWVVPGGRVGASDASGSDAACREAAEELGIDQSQIEMLGQLATRGPIVTGYIIEHYVGLLSPGTRLRPDSGEVAEVAVIPVADLIAPGRYFRGPAAVIRPEHSEGVVLESLASLRHYDIGADVTVWGLQADVLHELINHLLDGNHEF